MSALLGLLLLQFLYTFFQLSAQKLGPLELCQGFDILHTCRYGSLVYLYEIVSLYL